MSAKASWQDRRNVFDINVVKIIQVVFSQHFFSVHSLFVMLLFESIIYIVALWLRDKFKVKMLFTLLISQISLNTSFRLFI